MNSIQPATSLAILISGGLDSAILLGESLSHQEAVHPLYVRSSLFWEAAEMDHLRRYLAALESPHLIPLTVLELPVTDLYHRHWSLTGHGVPDEATSDDAVFLPGRNVLLLSKALLWCYLHNVPALALGTLGSNPFPDATLAFFDSFAELVNRAVGGRVEVRLPYRDLHKVEVMQRGKGLPLEWTFSCIRPGRGKHCGICNKCAERKRAFHDAGMPDPTEYDEDRSCSA
jgi:7-cyano-7-deazaguanine synthase